MAEEQRSHPYGEDEINLLDYWRVIWKYKFLIGALTAVSILIALIYSLLLPKIYISTTTILIPREGSGGGFLSALGASGIGRRIAGISLPSLTPNRDIFTSILKSRTLALNLVAHFNLKDYYKALYLENAIGALRYATTISASKEGVIKINVEDTDPKMAADIANSYPEQLDRFMAEYDTGAAGLQRRFIEGRLTKTKAALKRAEKALRDFQQENRAMSIKKQAQGAIQASARLKGEIVASEVQLQVMQNFATELYPELGLLECS